MSKKFTFRRISYLFFAFIFLPLTPFAQPAQHLAETTLIPPAHLTHPANLKNHSLEINGIRGFGTTDFGGLIKHDLLLVELGVTYTLTKTFAPDSWWGGSLEGLGQFITGAQDSPEGAYLVGINPGLRYRFHTECRWKPYFSLGAGVMLTDIEGPDLSLKFQFFEHAGPGIQYHFNDAWALNLSYRFMHISNAGIRQPNHGVNSHLAVLGVAYHF